MAAVVVVGTDSGCDADREPLQPTTNITTPATTMPRNTSAPTSTMRLTPMRRGVRVS